MKFFGVQESRFAEKFLARMTRANDTAELVVHLYKNLGIARTEIYHFLSSIRHGIGLSARFMRSDYVWESELHLI